MSKSSSPTDRVDGCLNGLIWSVTGKFSSFLAFFPLKEKHVCVYIYTDDFISPAQCPGLKPLVHAFDRVAGINTSLQGSTHLAESSHQEFSPAAPGIPPVPHSRQLASFRAWATRKCSDVSMPGETLSQQGWGASGKNAPACCPSGRWSWGHLVYFLRYLWRFEPSSHMAATLIAHLFLKKIIFIEV